MKVLFQFVGSVFWHFYGIFDNLALVHQLCRLIGRGLIFGAEENMLELAVRPYQISVQKDGEMIRPIETAKNFGGEEEPENIMEIIWPPPRIF